MFGASSSMYFCFENCFTSVDFNYFWSASSFCDSIYDALFFWFNRTIQPFNHMSLAIETSLLRCRSQMIVTADSTTQGITITHWTLILPPHQPSSSLTAHWPQHQPSSSLTGHWPYHHSSWTWKFDSGCPGYVSNGLSCDSIIILSYDCIMLYFYFLVVLYVHPITAL